MTNREWLEKMSNTNESAEEDSTIMQSMMRRAGFPKAVCTWGIAYPEGHGTMDFPPTSIHQMAKVILEVGKEQAEAKS